MKILLVDLQKAIVKNNINNKIEGYQRVSEERYRRFHFVNSFETFRHLCGFQETRWENDQNIFTWTTLCLQRIIIEIRRGFN